MIPVQCVILFTKISRIGNKVVCLYSGNFRLNYVFIQLRKDRHICLILLLYFLLHQRSFLNFVVKNFQDGFQYFIFELCFCILIFGCVVGHESGFKRWSSPEGGDPERIRIQAQHSWTKVPLVLLKSVNSVTHILFTSCCMADCCTHCLMDYGGFNI